ncbi:segregation/condensation protein A [Clostridium magnum]|uniref:Segregation and condensation protein A n=1 Tax=Clostridium magnum DSM 2767 TaxID=1121326 RepID=A0A162USN7_9CLOT|nr:segregation/condensation protein A [Clostridium magnum]KZL94240.1 segregation and condensation protein A [Clostridium magnum DSM 2767]SHH92050.1 condensin subunit ScpA [Clostridium magnum DSM 2767]
MSLNIKIENFEGPFDLLLHLIKKNKMDISDIKIYEITNQYLEYIHTMEEMDLEITSEFIVIAATLIEIKSKLLLPKSKDDESAADLDEKDSEKELIEKLIQYKKFKNAALFLKEREQGAGRIFSKKPEIIEEKKKNVNPKDFLEGVSILKLYELYSNLITTYRNKINSSNVINKEIPIDKFKIEDKMEYLKENIQIGKKVLFSDIINECTSKIEAVVTFLALLELMKLRYIIVVQEQNFTEIYVERTNGDEE